MQNAFIVFQVTPSSRASEPTIKIKTDVLSSQEESVPNITGSMSSVMFNDKKEGDFWGVFKTAQKQVDDSSGSGGMTCATRTVYFEASDSFASYGRRSEVAPANYTIRIWKRIS